MINAHTVITVQNRLYEGEPLRFRDIPELDIGRLPQLVHTRHHPIRGRSTRIAPAHREANMTCSSPGATLIFRYGATPTHAIWEVVP